VNEDNRSHSRAAVRVIAVAVLLVWSLSDNLNGVVWLWRPVGTFGFVWNENGIVTRIQRGSAADDARLAVGDRIDLRSISEADRATLYFPFDTNPDATVRLTVARAGGTKTLRLRAREINLSEPVKSVLAARLVLAILFLAVGVVLVLRRPRPMTWGFYLFAVTANPGSNAGLWLLGPTLKGANLVAELALAGISYAGLLMFALDFPRSLDVAWRRVLSRLIPYLFMIACALGGAGVAAFIFFGIPSQAAGTAFIATSSMLYALSLLVFLDTYIRSDGEDRQRVKWIMFGIAGTIPGFFVASIPSIPQPYWLHSAFILLTGIVPVTVAYAVLTHRVLDVNFVVSRTLIYSALTAAVITIFALVDWFVGKVLAQTKLLLIVEIIIAVGIGFWISEAHQAVSRHIDRLLFRRRHEAKARLRRVAAGLPHARTVEAVDELLVAEPAEAMALSSAALFRRNDDRTFVREAAVGWSDGTTTSVDTDTRLVLHLEGERGALRLHREPWLPDGLPTGRARAWLALPLFMRHELCGFTLYGAHSSGEDFDPEEIRELNDLAVAAAAAYDHLDAKSLRNENKDLRRRLNDLTRENEHLRSTERRS